MTDRQKDLSWIDDFWKQAGAHIFAREEDSVLILPPNKVYKANATAAKLIQYLKNGGSMAKLSLPSDKAKEDTALFFGDLAALYQGQAARNGCVCEMRYDFSFTRLPILGEIALTYRCNNACLFCYAGCAAGSSDAAAKRPELDTQGFKKIIDIFADKAKIPFFSFTGGEPLLREDLEELIAYASSRNLVTNLVSNGTLITEKRAKQLKKAGLGSAQISIEAPEESLHDTLCGRTGAFTACISGIKALQSAGIPTQTNTTITRMNLPCIKDMPEFLDSLGIKRFAMNLFIPTQPAPQADRLFIPYEEIGSYIDELTVRSREKGLVFYWYSPTPFCVYNPIAKGHGNKSCAAADGLVSIAPDGALLPCSSWDSALGKLPEEDFNTIWFSAEAGCYKQKDYAPDICKNCPSFTACQGACPLYWQYTGSTPEQRSCS